MYLCVVRIDFSLYSIINYVILGDYKFAEGNRKHCNVELRKRELSSTTQLKSYSKLNWHGHTIHIRCIQNSKKKKS